MRFPVFIVVIGAAFCFVECERHPFAHTAKFLAPHGAAHHDEGHDGGAHPEKAGGDAAHPEAAGVQGHGEQTAPRAGGGEPEKTFFPGTGEH